MNAFIIIVNSASLIEGSGLLKGVNIFSNKINDKIPENIINISI